MCSNSSGLNTSVISQDCLATDISTTVVSLPRVQYHYHRSPLPEAYSVNAWGPVSNIVKTLCVIPQWVLGTYLSRPGEGMLWDSPRG